MVFDLDAADSLFHAVDDLAWLEDIHIRVTFLPESVILVVIDTVQRIAYKPCLTFIALRSVCESDEFVAVGIYVQACRPCPVSSVKDGSVEGEFKTTVLRGSDIGCVGTYSGGARKAETQENILGIHHIIFNGAAETTLPESEVETEVPCLGVFPSQVFVRQSGYIVSGSVFFVAKVVWHRAETTQSSVCGDSLIGCLTVAHAEFQLVKPALGALHEAFVVDVPTGGDSWIGVPFVARSQTG
ncbi:unknown [Bacteroides sp. CAG:1060]|nr:unknown [Bacteroides sp. CAG:1060]